jgi:hypothetical protein
VLSALHILDKAHVMATHTTADVSQKQKRSMSSTMRAAALFCFGGPEALTIHELPVPKFDADEILIAVHTARRTGADWARGRSRCGAAARVPHPGGAGYFSRAA